MTTRWRQYIEKGVRDAGGPVAFGLQQWAFLFPLYVTISQVLAKGGRILDVGCGAGIYTALIAHHGYEAVGVDEDPEIVSFAQDMVGFLRSPARIERASAFDLSAYHGSFGLAYSLGVVEHFDRDVTIRLIQEQARCAALVLVAVPTRYTRHAAEVTDERLYTKRQVEQMVREAGLSVRRSYVYGEVPTALAKNLERFLPRAAYTRFKNTFTYGMGIVVLASR